MTALPLPPLWAYLGKSGAIRVWASALPLGLSGPVWACLGVSNLGLSGTIWAYLGLSGRVWASLGPFPVAMSGKPAAEPRQNLYKKQIIYVLFCFWRAEMMHMCVSTGRVPFKKHIKARIFQ